MARPSGRPIRDEVMTAARSLIQRGGVNGFSYGDLAKTLGIKAPSIHHHFPRKDDLVAAVTVQYREEFNGSAAVIADDPALDGPTARIQAYAKLFAATAAADRMCLCGAVSAEWVGVGDSTREEVGGFFDDQVRWLRDQLRLGVADGSFRAELNVDRSARLILSALEGAILLSRAGDRSDLATTVCDAQLELLAA
ncbi:MAG: TetR/AcrR family transcriptional regulator [Actinomycetota bacterium]